MPQHNRFQIDNGEKKLQNVHLHDYWDRIQLSPIKKKKNHITMRR